MPDKTSHTTRTPLVLLLTGGDLRFGDDAASQQIGGRMQRALFVVLALNAGRMVSRDWLADLLWPDATQAAARQRLRMTALNLRRSLAGDPRIRIEGATESLGLDLAPSEVDVGALFSCSPDAGRAEKWQAAALFAGDLLPHFPEISEEFDRHLADRREAVRRHALSLLHALMRDAEAAADPIEFGRAGDAARAIDPCDETTVERELRFWAALGAPDRVSRAFAAYRENLRADLDAEPDAEMLARYDVLLRQAEGQRPAAPAKPPGLAPPKGAARPAPPPPAPAPTSAAAKLALPLVLLAVAAAGLIHQRTSLPDSGPVFLVRQTIADFPRCTADQRTDRHAAGLLKALEGIERGTIVMGPLRRALTRARPDVYEIDQSISCTETGVRSTITLIERETQSVLLSLRIEGADIDTDALRAEISADLPNRPN